MRKHYLLLIVFCALTGLAYSQYYWQELGTGSNALNPNGDIYSITSDPSGNIYAAGAFTDSSGHYYVAKWNGQNWSELSPGIGALNSYPLDFICSDLSGNIYATTYNIQGGNVAKWAGNSWVELGTGSNALNAPGGVALLCTDGLGNLYSAAVYSQAFGSYFLSKWNGNSWIALGQGTDSLEINGSIYSMGADIYGDVFIGGTFSHNTETYVDEWNGTSWNQAGNGFYEDYIYYIYVDRGGNVYISWNNSVSKLDGNSWSEIGGSAGGLEGEAYNICVYDSENIYASLISPDYTTGFYYINKWDGSNWSQLGTGNYDLQATSYINAICTDVNDNVYAAGGFTDGTGHRYVAKYSLLPPAELYVFLTSTTANCKANGSVTTMVHGGTPPFRYLWNNNDTASNLISTISGNYSLTVTDSLGKVTYAHAFVDSTCSCVVNGVIFHDVNGNCIYNGTDSLLANQIVQMTASNGISYYGTSDVNGHYSIEIADSGIFQFASNYYTSACSQEKICSNYGDSLFLPSLGDTVNNVNLAIISSGPEFDLSLHPGWTSANPGFTKQYWVMPYNLSPAPLTGQATIIFTYDSNLIYQSSQAPLPTVDTIAHTLTWMVNGSTIPYPSFDWYNERFISNFLVPSNLNPNYQLQSSFVIKPTTGDCDSLNNYFNFFQVVNGSHDPNSKEVSPAGAITSDDSVLTYTINYQNTGTDSTNFIIVKDTLSSYLDPITVVNLASSDRYSAFNISGTGILTWTFNPLRIPDSATNATASKGFIMFSVKKKAGLPIGTRISNSATIYFDYNVGVRTNTVTDTVALPTGVENLNLQNRISVTAYPNPFSDLTHIVVNGINRKYDFELFDVTGRLQVRMASLQSNEFNLSRGELPPGIYLYRIILNNQPVGYGKLVVQ